MRSLVAIFLFAGTSALAQPPGPVTSPQGDARPPLLSGAIKFADSEAVHDLPHAVDAGWRGEKVCELLFENESMRAARCSFPPGVGHEKHFHNAHWGYILEGGVMEITDAEGTREQETPTGGSWWSDGVAWHEAINIGDTTTTYIIVEPKGAAGRPPFRPALRAHLDAIENKDLAAFKPTLTTREDLRVVFPNGEVIETTDGVIAFHEEWFRDANWRWEGEVVNIIEGVDMAAAFMKYEYRDTPDGAPRAAWLALIFKLEDGAWRLVHDQNTRINTNTEPEE